MLKTTNSVRYLNKNNNANERENYAKWWKEQIEHYGTSVTYFTHGYSLTSHNFLYGEDPTSKYQKVENVIMLTDITNDALMLSKFGIMADCDMTAVVHISSFYEKIGFGFEPKAGDLIQLTEYGADRPGGRSAPIYEITERDDEYLPMTNPLIGHYVWYIKCKRFEYSYEPGIVTGSNNKQISDGGDYGKLANNESLEEMFQPYPDSVQNSAKTIYDYYSEDPSGLDLNPNHFYPPLPPSAPADLKVTEFNRVEGPYPPEADFTVADQSLVQIAAQGAQVAPNVFVSSNVQSSNGLDTFAGTTSANPDDVFVYNTSNNESIQLNTYDGGNL